MPAPKIATAIPQRRYLCGNYHAVLLGEIESGDGLEYQYILALVREGEARPDCYVTCERLAPRSARAAGGRYRLRVIAPPLDEELEVSDRYGDIETFAAEALQIAARVLGLDDKAPQRIM
jgi:hypothetical protein